MSGVFDEHDSAWNKEYHELKGLLTEEEYRSARSSTLTSHYTPPIVPQALPSAPESIAFAGANVLEPGTGVGHFLGTIPVRLRKNSRCYDVARGSLHG